VAVGADFSRCQRAAFSAGEFSWHVSSALPSGRPASPVLLCGLWLLFGLWLRWRRLAFAEDPFSRFFNVLLNPLERSEEWLAARDTYLAESGSPREAHCSDSDANLGAYLQSAL
jgi:hypothetical protein